MKHAPQHEKKGDSPTAGHDPTEGESLLLFLSQGGRLTLPLADLDLSFHRLIPILRSSKGTALRCDRQDLLGSDTIFL